MELQTLTAITSTTAIVLSAFTLGWNVYKDVIRKPRFRVSVKIMTIIQRGRPDDGPHIFLEALNVGPISNRIGVPFAQKNWFRRKIMHDKDGSAFITPDFANQAASKPSEKIEVGDKATFVFPYRRNSFFNEKFVRIGVSDGFGQMHWAPKKQLKKLYAEYRMKFPDLPEERA